MVRRVVSNQLLHSLLGLLLAGLFLGGSTAGYCFTKREHNRPAACSKKTDPLEQFTRSAPAVDALSPVHSPKFPVFALFLPRKPVLAAPRKPAKALGLPVCRGTYLASILVNCIVRNAP